MAQLVIIDGPGTAQAFDLDERGVGRIGSDPGDSIRLAPDSVGPAEAEVFKRDEKFQIRSTSDGRALLLGASRAVQISGVDTAEFHVRKAWVDVKSPPAVLGTP